MSILPNSLAGSAIGVLSKKFLLLLFSPDPIFVDEVPFSWVHLRLGNKFLVQSIWDAFSPFSG